jgi:hypothetical protein
MGPAPSKPPKNPLETIADGLVSIFDPDRPCWNELDQCKGDLENFKQVSYGLRNRYNEALELAKQQRAQGVADLALLDTQYDNFNAAEIAKINAAHQAEVERVKKEFEKYAVQAGEDIEDAKRQADRLAEKDTGGFEKFTDQENELFKEQLDRDIAGLEDKLKDQDPDDHTIRNILLTLIASGLFIAFFKALRDKKK